jgi:hypothetical protein
MISGTSEVKDNWTPDSRGDLEIKCYGDRVWSSVASDVVSRLPWADDADHRLSGKSLAGLC